MMMSSAPTAPRKRSIHTLYVTQAVASPGTSSNTSSNRASTARSSGLSDENSRGFVSFSLSNLLTTRMTFRAFRYASERVEPEHPPAEGVVIPPRGGKEWHRFRHFDVCKPRRDRLRGEEETANNPEGDMEPINKTMNQLLVTKRKVLLPT